MGGINQASKQNCLRKLYKRTEPKISIPEATIFKTQADRINENREGENGDTEVWRQSREEGSSQCIAGIKEMKISVSLS